MADSQRDGKYFSVILVCRSKSTFLFINSTAFSGGETDVGTCRFHDRSLVMVTPKYLTESDFSSGVYKNRE